MAAADRAGLLAQSGDPDTKRRKKAVAGIRKAGDPSTVAALDGALRIEQDAKVAGALLSAIHELGGAGAPGALAFGLTALDLGMLWRSSLVAWLGEYPDDPAGLDALIEALGDGSGTVRQGAALSLAHYGAARAAEAVSEAFRSERITPARGGGRPTVVAVAVARTLDLFVGDDSVRDAFAVRVGSNDTVMAALRIGSIPQAEGGVVALQDRLIVAVRQRTRLTMPQAPNRLFEAPYREIDEFGWVGTGFRIRRGDDIFQVGIDDDFDVSLKLNRWLWQQWQPHVRRIAGMIETAKQS